MNINKLIEKVSKRNLVFPEEYSFDFNGRKHTFTLYKHYESRSVSLCNRANCSAGKDCCHYRKVSGVGLCCELRDCYTLRVGSDLCHGIAFDISDSDEEGLISFAQNILDIIGGEREVSHHQ